MYFNLPGFDLECSLSPLKNPIITLVPRIHLPFSSSRLFLFSMTAKKHRILIAEDFEDNRIALKLMLKLAGFEALEAADGQQAIEVTQRDRPDLILMDISLPTIDGLQATRTIRSNADFQQLPIIIFSAHDSAESRDEAQEAGGTSYLTKPIEFEELRKVIEWHLAD